jgi:hypothetical protein
MNNDSDSNQLPATAQTPRDETEQFRRARQLELNAFATARAELVERHGQVWNTDELRADFEVLGFLAPFVVVKEKATGQKGSLEFQHSPRFYFNWKADSPGLGVHHGNP